MRTKTSTERRKACNISSMKIDKDEDLEDLRSSLRLAKYVSQKLDSVLVKYPNKK